MFMFLSWGQVQYVEHDGWYGPVYARTREEAETFAATHLAKKVSIAKIGTLEGETFERQIVASIEAGANCSFAIADAEKGTLAVHKFDDEMLGEE